MGENALSSVVAMHSNFEFFKKKENAFAVSETACVGLEHAKRLSRTVQIAAVTEYSHDSSARTPMKMNLLSFGKQLEGLSKNLFPVFLCLNVKR